MKKRLVIFLLCIAALVCTPGISGRLTSKASNELWEGWTRVGGNWDIQSNGNLKINNLNIGEAFYISDQYMDANNSFVYEFDAQIEAGTLGLIFAVENKRNPTKQWRCLSINAENVGTSFLIKNSKTLYLKACSIPEMSDGAEYRNIKMVYIAGDCVYIYVDGKLVESYKAAGFEAGYVGIMTNTCQATVRNIRCEQITPPSVSDINISIQTDDYTFDPTQYEYNLYPKYEETSVNISAMSPDAGKITINGQAVESGTDVQILLNIGYTRIDVAVYSNITDNVPTIHYYFHVHRENASEYQYNEEHRSQVHISTLDNGLNDPNGLLYDAYSKEYHLFCQYAPNVSIHDEEKAWYHFVSKDLIHWEDLGVAIETDALGQAWSGTGVIDYNNTSGLFDASVPPESRMVLIYTSAKGDTEFGIEKVSLAYSKDFGRTWIKYDGNPIIKNGHGYSPEFSDGFRDPKVLWYEDSSYAAGGVWIAIVGGGQYRMFSSPDLLNWKQEGACYDNTGKRKLYAECPDLFYLTGKDSNGNDIGSWVIIGSDYNGGDSKIFYYPGDIVRDEDGKLCFKGSQKRKELYEGGTIYSTQTIYNEKLGRQVAISWVREWLIKNSSDGATVKNWSGLLSWPLELSLVQSGSEYIVQSAPVEEMTALREELLYNSKDITVSDSNSNILSDINGSVLELVTTFKAENNAIVAFDLRGIKVTYNSGDSMLNIDAGAVGGGSRSIVASPDSNGKINLRVIVDKSVVGVYVNNGQSCDYVVAYPTENNTSLSLTVNNGSADIDDLSIYSLSSIWTDTITDTEEDDIENQTGKKAKFNFITVAIGAMAVCFAVLIGLVIKTVIGKKK
ncbi:MAG: hypothetical protein E7385_08725 [Ruminococcaceae bacterium]|nr:hypothetical protein [Oscillospiraceae bacterium]